MKKMIIPTDFQVSLKAMDVSGHYDWQKQAYQLENCKFGTTQWTTFQTGSILSGTSDSNSDSCTD